jgi:hypothetical protein
MDWSDLALNRNYGKALVHMAMNLSVPENVEKLFSS